MFDFNLFWGFECSVLTIFVYELSSKCQNFMCFYRPVKMICLPLSRFLLIHSPEIQWIKIPPFLPTSKIPSRFFTHFHLFKSLTTAAAQMKIHGRPKTLVYTTTSVAPICNFFYPKILKFDLWLQLTCLCIYSFVRDTRAGRRAFLRGEEDTRFRSWVVMWPRTSQKKFLVRGGCGHNVKIKIKIGGTL